MNLLIMLLVQRRFVAKGRIRAILYPDSSHEAFEKMFERDKEELRSLGVPIEVGQIDAFFDDEPGYRIPSDRFALPEVDLSAEEAAVVGLAARVWQNQRLAGAAQEAVRKLTAAGVSIDTSLLDLSEPQLADEPAFDVFFGAVIERSVIHFDYRRPGAVASTTRRLQPWGVTRAAGRWYVVGFDLDRNDERVFRLSRVQGRVRTMGAPGAYTIPESVDVAEVARRLEPRPHTQHAVVCVRTGTCFPLRRLADVVEEGVAGPDGTSGWDRLRISRGSMGLADDVCGLSPNVYVEEPAELRNTVIQRLTEATQLPAPQPPHQRASIS